MPQFCMQCTSNGNCIKCAPNYNSKGNGCINPNDEDDSDNLSKGAIIGIVFGCLGFLIIIAILIYFFLKKYIFKKDDKIENIDENNGIEAIEIQKENVPQTEGTIENDNRNQVITHKKRKINNK